MHEIQNKTQNFSEEEQLEPLSIAHQKESAGDTDSLVFFAWRFPIEPIDKPLKKRKGLFGDKK